MFESWDLDGCRCLFPWKRASESEAEPVSSALGAQIAGEMVALHLPHRWSLESPQPHHGLIPGGEGL